MIFFISVRIVISLLVLSIVAITAITLWVTPARNTQKKQAYSSPELTKMEEYESASHNFTISYPLPNRIIEYSPDAYSIGTMSGQVVIAVADMQILQLSPSQKFEEVVIDRAKKMCTYEGPDFSVSCTAVQKIQPINTDSGVQGLELFLQEENNNFITKKVTEKSRGPFFAFPISAGKSIMIYAPVTKKHQDVDYWAIRIIAESLKLVP